MLKKIHYILLTVILLITEIIIALYVHDNFIRPVFGDYLIVFLVYTGIKSVINLKPITAIIITMLFAYFVEIMQYVHIVEKLGYTHNLATRLFLGSSFSWEDMLAYTLGGLTIFYVEYQVINKRFK